MTDRVAAALSGTVAAADVKFTLLSVAGGRAFLSTVRERLGTVEEDVLQGLVGSCD